MDLIKLSRKAIRNPLYYRNFFVLFVTIFIALIIGLSLLSGFSFFSKNSPGPNQCDSSRAEKFSGNVSATKNAVYQLDFEGNKNCFLSAFFTWKKTKTPASIWIYTPEGKIEVIESTPEQTSALFLKNSPLSQGRWRFVVKAREETDVSYSGSISVK